MNTKDKQHIQSETLGRHLAKSKQLLYKGRSHKLHASKTDIQRITDKLHDPA